MKIFEISPDYNFALADITSKPDDIDILDLATQDIKSLEKIHYSWVTVEASTKPDLSIIVNELLCCNNRALEFLQPVLEGYEEYQSPIGDLPYNIIIPTKSVQDALNLKASKIKYFSTGDIMEISKAVFLPGEYPALFKVEMQDTSLFCNELLKNAIETANLKGLVFNECQMKSKSWFKF